MRIISRILILLLAAVSLSTIDIETAYELRVRDVIAQNHWEGSYSNLRGGWFEFTSTDGSVWRRYYGATKPVGGLIPKRIIRIDLRSIDTTGFRSYLNEVALIRIGMSFDPPIGSCMGNDGFSELSGRLSIGSPLENRNRMLRRLPGGFDFTTETILEEFCYFNNAVDINRNGITDLLADSSGSLFDFEATKVGQRDIRLVRKWLGNNGTAQVPRTSDLDGDGYPEVLVQRYSDIAVVKYNPNMQELYSPWSGPLPYKRIYRGYWAIGDFDRDGKGEFATASGSGEVVFFENDGSESGYRVSFFDTTRWGNAFFHTEGNDVDGDGRPGMWMETGRMRLFSPQGVCSSP